MDKSQLNGNSYRPSQNSDADSSNEDEWVLTTSKKSKPTNTRVNLSDPNLRVAVYSKVMTFCLPPELISQEAIKGESYFGRYGKVTNVVLNIDHPSNDLREERQESLIVQAFITYENEIDSSLAIYALQGYNHCGMWTKTSFGSVKYCQKFLNGLDCENTACYYIHKKNEENHISCKIRENYKNHLAKAREILSCNVKYIVQKEIEIQKKLEKKTPPRMRCTCTYEVKPDYVIFPPFEETVEKMLTQGVVDRQQYKYQRALLTQVTNVSTTESETKSTPNKVIIDESEYPSLSELKLESSSQNGKPKLRKKAVYILKSRSRSQAYTSINPERQQILEEINPELTKLVHTKLLVKTIIRGLQPRSRLAFAAGLNQKAVNTDCLKYSRIISQAMII